MGGSGGKRDLKTSGRGCKVTTVKSAKNTVGRSCVLNSRFYASFLHTPDPSGLEQVERGACARSMRAGLAKFARFIIGGMIRTAHQGT